MDELFHRYQQTLDPADFRRLVDRHIDSVYSHCRLHLRDSHLAEDVTQVVFLMLARKAPRLDPGTVVAGWLFTAARFACANARRNEGRRRKYEQQAATMRSETETTGPVETAELSDSSTALHEAMTRLGPRDRDTLLMRYFERLSTTELGTRLGISEQTARQRVSRAVAKLRGLMTTSTIIPEAAVIGLLEKGAAIKAPSGLAALAASTQSAGAQASAAADVALRAMAYAKIKIAAACIALAGVIGATGLAIPRLSSSPATQAQAMTQPAAPGPIPPAPPAAPATAPAVEQTPAELANDLAGTLMKWAAGYREHNFDALGQVLLFDDSVPSRFIQMRLRTEVDLWWLRHAWEKAFPNQRSRQLTRANGLDPGDHGLDQEIEQICKTIFADSANNNDAVADGDFATLTIPESKRRPGSPPPKDHPDPTMHFRRIDGHWKVDVLKTFQPRAGNAQHPLTAEQMQAQEQKYTQRFNAVANFAETTAREIESGKYNTPQAADAAIAERAKSLPPPLNIDVKPVGG